VGVLELASAAARRYATTTKQALSPELEDALSMGGRQVLYGVGGAVSGMALGNGIAHGINRLRYGAHFRHADANDVGAARTFANRSNAIGREVGSAIGGTYGLYRGLQALKVNRLQREQLERPKDEPKKEEAAAEALTKSLAKS
jgi:hypothetical protein